MRHASLIPDWVPFFFLPLRKPPGPTSHDAVALVRRCMGRDARVGHMGTLDPFASGVLLVGVGKATRFANDVFTLKKRYRGVIALGAQTDTLDATGVVVERADPVPLDDSVLNQVAQEFQGRQMQVPPAYSAKKIKGKRSYQLAREDKATPLPAHAIEITELSLTPQGPAALTIDVTCSTGTYVRSLARDIAIRLGTRGHLTQLERISIGPVTLKACLELDQLSVEQIAAHRWAVARILPQFPEILLPQTCFPDLRHGRTHQVAEPLPAAFLGIVGEGDAFRAVFRCNFVADQQAIVPKMLCFEKDEAPQA